MAACRQTFSTGGRLFAALLIFTSLTAAQPTEKTIWSFAGAPRDGSFPRAGLVPGLGDAFFGVTPYGGSGPCTNATFGPGCGAVFSLTPAWTEAVIYSFPSEAEPRTALTFAPGNVLYGTTAFGGTFNQGTVFSMNPPSSSGGAWTEATLYSFTGDSDGGAIASSVVIDGSTGVLYGVTGQGGTSNKGTVYSLTPPAAAGGAWTETVLYNFTGAPTDGSGPTGVTIGGGGVLYGTTGVGGAASAGTVFSLTPPASAGGSWTEQIIHNFGASEDGQLPSSGVVSGAGGVLYGTTLSGGSAGVGTVFALQPPASPGSPWTETVIHNFAGSESGDGASPSSPVIIGNHGVVFGTTRTGGIGNDYGTVFALTPPAAAGDPWAETILWSFTAGADGLDPTGGVVFGPGELLFGATQGGGSAALGTAFYVKP